MTVSTDERESLHFVLDALLNARASLEKVDVASLEPGLQYSSRWSRPRAELFRDGSIFLRRVLGPMLHRAELNHLFETKITENVEGADLLATLANAMRSILPLLMKEGRDNGDGSNEVIERIIEDFMGMYWGDEPRFFPHGQGGKACTDDRIGSPA